MLDGLPGHANQFAPFLDFLEIQHNRLSIRIVFQVLDVLMEFDANRISCTDDLAEPRSSHVSIVGEGINDISALGNDRKVPFVQRGNAEKVHVCRGAIHATTVRPDDIGSRPGGHIEYLCFDPFALFTGLTEARCDDDDAFGPHSDAIGNSRRNEPRWDDHHDQVYGPVDIENAWVGLPRKDLRSLGVD